MGIYANTTQSTEKEASLKMCSCKIYSKRENLKIKDF